LEGLKTLQAQLAENSERLFDLQCLTMRTNESILEVQQTYLRNTELLAGVLHFDNLPKDEPPVSRSMLHEMFGEWTTQFLARLNDDIPMKYHGNLRAVLATLLANLDGVVLSMRDYFKLVAQCETS
jgi:tRNA U34 5-methylaminomethyl-2-thiouridine-forming methyltransferase MnmC